MLTTVDNDVSEFVTYIDGTTNDLFIDTPNILNPYSNQAANGGGFSQGYVSNGTVISGIGTTDSRAQISGVYSLVSSVSFRFGDVTSNLSYHSIGLNPCITNTWENEPVIYENIDTDGDGIPNHLDLDSDNDGCSDALEANTTTNQTTNYQFPSNDVSTTGVPNTATASSGTDHVNAAVTACDCPFASGVDTDGDGVDDVCDLDDDNDGILDTEECFPFIDSNFNNWDRNGGWGVIGDGANSQNQANGVNNQSICFTVPDVSSISSPTEITFQTSLRTNGSSNKIINNRYADLIFSVNDIDYVTFRNPNDNSSSNATVTTTNGASTSLSSFAISTTSGPYTTISITIPWSGNDDTLELCYTMTADNDDWNVSTTKIIDANTYTCNDTDGDGIPNYLDLDSDNDGIIDIIEAGGTDTTRDGKVDNIDSTGKLLTDADNDGFADAYDGSIGTPLITTGTDTNNDGIADTYTKGDADTDNLPNFLDIDADNDGIPDNVEGQSTSEYKAPTGIGSGVSGITDTNKNGVDDAYEVGGFGIIPENTDGIDNPDYLDSDSDNDGVLDIEENGDTTNNVLSEGDADGDGLFDIFDDNNDSSIAGATVNDGANGNDTVIDLISLENSFKDTDNDFDPLNPTTGNLDYRDIPDAANAMITQVYQFGVEKWIEITNIGTTTIPANTIKIQLYKDKTIDDMVTAPNTPPTTPSVTVSVKLLAGKSVLFRNIDATSINNLGTTNIITNPDLTDLEQTTNDIITLSTAIGTYSWANRYDMVSNIGNKTSVVRIDDRGDGTFGPLKDYMSSDWVVFIDDAITPYQPIGDTEVTGTKRHPQDPLIS